MPINRAEYDRARRALGLTHAEVARRVPVDRVSVMRWLAGVSDPTPDHLLALARALAVPDPFALWEKNGAAGRLASPRLGDGSYPTPPCHGDDFP